MAFQRTYTFFLFLVILVFFSSCQQESKTTSKPASVTPKLPTNANSNQQMAYLLDSLANTANIETCYNLNELRARDFAQKISNQTDINKKLQLQVGYSQELINAGKTTEAINELLSILSMIGGNNIEIDKNNKLIFELLGLAYLRKGEQDNCIANHSANSCILPLKGDAIHTLKSGSENAILTYTKILQKFPDDYQTRWLYNLAYMTLGQYPDQVPPSWRIPEKNFLKQPTSLKAFNNRAIDVGLDITGLSGGCCVEDFNNDGNLDVFMTSYGFKDPSRLFFSDGNGSYKDVTTSAGLKGITGGLNTTHADYNNDGFVDIFVTRGGWFGKGGKLPNSLLKNNGDGTFTDVTVEAGLLSFHPTQTAAWADVNQDGFLDLYIGNESQPGNIHPCELFMNKGDGTFVDFARVLKVQHIGFVKGVRWGDINNDQLPDLYISELGNKNKLYVNRGGTNAGDWQFEEISAKANVAEPIFSFPAWFFDYDNDGFEDLLVASYDMTRLKNVSYEAGAEYLGKAPTAALPKLYRNNGDETFTDLTKKAGLEKVMFAMGSNFGDLDNDGFLDFYIGTGEPDLRSVVPNRMFRNKNGKAFEEVTMSAGFGHIQKGHGVAFADMDNDGDQDIYCVIGGAYQGDVSQNVLFENPNEQNNWITILLEGTQSNRSAIGARIKLTLSNGKTIHRTVGTGGTFGSSSLQQEIGIGKATKIFSIDITWPKKGSEVATYKNISANQVIKIMEGQGEVIKLERKKIPFQKKEGGHAGHQHH